MDFKDYQKRAYVAIQPHADEKDEVLNWAVGLAEEVGEVLNIIKHKYWGREDINREEVIKELGDVLWYTSALAKVLGINLQAAAELNVAKLEHRFNTGDFREEDSKNRHSKEKDFKKTEVYKKIIEGAML